jgi:HrpA-like RNA helicase
MFCTTGIVLQNMRSNPDMDHLSHIILDEVHERDLFNDVLIGILKDLLRRRPDMKLIMMSASLNVAQFSKFFGHCPIVQIQGRCHVVREHYLEDILAKLKISATKVATIKNKTKTLRESARYLHQYGKTLGPLILDLEIDDALDYDLIAKLVKRIHQKKPVAKGAILIFLPGWGDIEQMWYRLFEQYLDVRFLFFNKCFLKRNHIFKNVHFLTG